MSKIRASEVVAKDRAKMKFRYRYGCAEASDPFLVFAVCSGEKPWAMFLSYPVARLYDDGVVMPIPWTEDSLRDAMFHVIQNVKGCYGGDWHLEIRHNTPADLSDVRRRWAPKPAMKSVPPAAKQVKIATREMLDRLAQPKELPPPYHANMTDEEFFNHESALLRATEPSVVDVPVGEEMRF